MAVDKIDPRINTQNLLNERLKEAASGKKTNVHNINAYNNKDIDNSSDSLVFSEDAKKLQETEVILRNALQKLHEMDDVNLDSFSDITEKISDDFYKDDELSSDIADLIIPESQMRENIQKRIKADEYVDQLSQMDNTELPLDQDKLNLIKEKINSGFYNSPSVSAAIADSILANFQ
jgi:anti-sigma28 factor (negative regulator of flagellin synthesis)